MYFCFDYVSKMNLIKVELFGKFVFYMITNRILLNIKYSDTHNSVVLRDGYLICRGGYLNE